MFGAVLLSLFTSRMESLKVEIASRPMRSFAMSVVAVLGWFGVTLALCITIVGIPLALVLVVGALHFVGGFVKLAVVLVGLGAVASTRGAGLFPSKNRPSGSPYRDASPAL